VAKLFGPDRIRPGYPDQEWAVWITGMDDVLPQPDLTTALILAAEHNATAVAVNDGHPHTPVTHAVVLHHGYAWQRPRTTPNWKPSVRPELWHRVDCALCDRYVPGEDDDVAYFPTPDLALRGALDSDWTQLPDGRLLCDTGDPDHQQARADAKAAAQPREEIPGQATLDDTETPETASTADDGSVR
jgi:hypothetical protein